MSWDDMWQGSTKPQGSSRGPVSMPRDVAPLEVYPPQGNNYGCGETADRTMDEPWRGNLNGETSFRSQSNQFIADRAKELSEAESPHLRQLGFSLGNMVQVETPIYQPQRSFRPAHLEIHDIAHRWQVLQGCNDWKGILDPFDNALKAEIIRYGEFAQATYDAFDGNSQSLTHGDSLFNKESLLEGVGLGNRGYEITKFIYATSSHLINSCLNSVKRGGGDHGTRYETHWIGFVAVCTSPEEILRLGRRDIVIAWRGTRTFSDWITDLSDYMSVTGFGPDHDCSHIRVQAGFYNIYVSKNSESEKNGISARDQVLSAIKALVEKYNCEGKLSITVTGHSMGSALATLCAYDIAVSNYNLMSDLPTTPKRWNSEGLRTGALSTHEDGQCRSLQHPHFESLMSRIHNAVHHHHHLESEISDKEMLVRHPHTGAMRNYLHSKIHDITMDGHHIIEDMKNRYSNESALDQFPQGKIPITVFSFAGPRVGNAYFRDRLRELGVAVLRIVNVNDWVPMLPGLKQISWAAAQVATIIPRSPTYKHVGVKLQVDNLKSLFLKPHSLFQNGISQVHSLDTYLHLVDVYRGRNQYVGPTEKTFRDIALVNRTADFLLAKYCIPPRWGRRGNGEVARDSHGNWVFPGRLDRTDCEEDDEFPELWQRAAAVAAERSHW